MKCHNKYCSNDLLEYRAKKITTSVSRWWFCIRCLRSDSPIIYKCRRPQCNEEIFFKNSRAFCSPLCKSRFHYNTKPSSLGTCQRCSKVFVTNLGYSQKFCGAGCRKKARNRLQSSHDSSTTIIKAIECSGTPRIETRKRRIAF